MLRAERQAKILQIIREKGFIETHEIAMELNVSDVTIRRDLNTLSEQNLIRLDHGGSTKVDYLEGNTEPLYETKVYLNHTCKEAIGEAAAALVQNFDTIILDSGTTNAQIAHHLRHSKLRNITVITCDLVVARELCAEPNITVLMLGGILRRSFYSAYGTYTEKILRNLKADKFFLGIDAASLENGISNIVLEEVPIKQLSIEISNQIIVVADSSKFGHNAPFRVCGWEEVDRVITGVGIQPELVQHFVNNKIEYQLVSVECNEDKQIIQGGLLSTR
jgi:DeoR/GlpR family transcriptional regulator of sugar metabolism